MGNLIFYPFEAATIAAKLQLVGITWVASNVEEKIVELHKRTT